MPDTVDPEKLEPDYDWRSEVNWAHLRRLVWWHILLWMFGGVEFVLFSTGLLEGVTRTLIGLADYLIWGTLLVLLFRVVSRPRYREGGNHMVSGPTFLILVAFMGSLLGFVFLLSFMNLDTVELFPNPETSLPVMILTLLSGAFILAGFAVAWRATSRRRHLITWVMTIHPDAWSRLPWAMQKIFLGIAIERLRHAAFQNNDDFLAMYKELGRLQREMIIYLIVGAVCIAVVIFGTSFGRWRW